MTVMLLRRRQVVVGLLSCTALAGCGGGDSDATTSSVGLGGQPAPAPTPTPTPTASGMPIVYDTTMGTGFDADGLTSFPQRTGSKRIFVDSANGNDGFNGLSPYPSAMGNGAGNAFQDGATGKGGADARFGPKKTLAAAFGLVTSGAGDQVLITGSFPDSFGSSFVGKGGYSAQYPTCARSYNGADPWNAATYGRTIVNFGTAGAGTIGIFSFGNQGTADYLAFQGVAFTPAYDPGNYIMLLNARNWLLENCRFQNCDGAFSGINDSRILNNVIVRRCSFFAGGDNGLFAGAMTGLVVEDCVFWRNGIPLGTTRDTAPATALTHGLYLSTSCQDAIVRRCIISDPSATGCMMRGGGQIYHNVFLKCPISVIMGAGDQYGRAYPGEPARNVLYVTANPSSGETFTVNGIVFTAGRDFAIGATPAATMDNLKLALDASTNSLVAQIKLGNPYTYSNQSGIAIGPFSPGYVRRQFQSYEAVFIDYDGAFNANTVLAISASGPVATVYTMHPDANPATDHGTTVSGYKPNGVNCEVHHNLILGDADINSTNPRGTGIYICNTKAGSTVHHNIVARSRNMTGMNVVASDVQSGYPQPTTVQFDRNVFYQWGAAVNALQYFSATQNHDTYTRNIWDRAASGSNTNGTTASLPNPITRPQLNTALGFADDDTMMSNLCNNPATAWAKKILDTALPGYGLSYAND